MATNKKKMRKNPKQNLNCQPTRCLEWRCCSFAQAEARSGALTEALAGDAHAPTLVQGCVSHKHHMWTNTLCDTMVYKPFNEVLNGILNPTFPLLVDEEHKQVTHWNRQISQAVDAYRAMLTMEENAKVIALQLSVLAEMACTCPACFGPGVSKLPNGEPKVVVESMRQKIKATDTATALKAAAEMVDPCTQAHTAANDVRGKKDWKGMTRQELQGWDAFMIKYHGLSTLYKMERNTRAMYPHTLMEWILEATAYPHQDANGKDGQKVAILFDIMGKVLRYSTKQHRPTALHVLCLYLNEKGQAETAISS
ncbi:hypothetical protein DFH28DRAFT_928482 [Melampsora americana]|nr:hypothetical protein DFH28DRAFT_928482 [Melampsora americana]